MKKRKPTDSYSTAHMRIYAERGWASDYDCVGDSVPGSGLTPGWRFDCPNMAEEWSYDHTDPDEFLASRIDPE